MPNNGKLRYVVHLKSLHYSLLDFVVVYNRVNELFLPCGTPPELNAEPLLCMHAWGYYDKKSFPLGNQHDSDTYSTLLTVIAEVLITVQSPSVLTLY